MSVSIGKAKNRRHACYNHLAFYYIGSPRNCGPLILQNEPTGNPSTNPYNHDIAAERAEEFTPFCAVASSNRASPSPSRLWSIILYYLVTWRKGHEHCRERTQYERSRIGTDFVGVRRRRSRDLGAAHLLLIFFVISLHRYT